VAASCSVAGAGRRSSNQRAPLNKRQQLITITAGRDRVIEQIKFPPLK
jgi:hypothetical protein